MNFQNADYYTGYLDRHSQSLLTVLLDNITYHALAMPAIFVQAQCNLVFYTHVMHTVFSYKQAHEIT